MKVMVKTATLLCFMPSKTLILTALPCEAAPLIQAWDAKPLREHPCAERFQVFHAHDTYIATTGIGKVRAAIATSALLTGLFPGTFQGESTPLVVNIGIAGSSDTTLSIGTLTYINKVRDVATNTRFYPDILVRHSLPESSLDTHDHPVTTMPATPGIVDMEGSGIVQAATTLGPPSSLCILKVISDYCNGTRISQQAARSLIAQHTDSIHNLLHTIHSSLPEPARLSADDRALLEASYNHAALSLSQRIELQRRITALQAQGIPWSTSIARFLTLPITTKEARNTAYTALLSELCEAVTL